MTTEWLSMCIGDMQITLRSWPTPDPTKCTAHDRIGVLVGDLPVLFDAQSSMEGGRWVNETYSIGADGREEVELPDTLNPHGWFWATEARPLAWSSFASTARGVDTEWFSEWLRRPPGARLSSSPASRYIEHKVDDPDQFRVRIVFGAGSRAYHVCNPELRPGKSHSDGYDLDEYGRLEEAQRQYARWARNLRTRRC